MTMGRYRVRPAATQLLLFHLKARSCCGELPFQISAKIDKALGVEPVKLLAASSESKELERKRLLQVIVQHHPMHNWTLALTSAYVTPTP